MATRLDLALVARGLARSRTHAQRMIAAGSVRVAGQVVRSSATPVGPEAEVTAVTDPYVSRAAYKLLSALEDFGLTVAGRGLDAGASTGGFTQVLLERGVDPVYAVDVGRDQLHPVVRADPRVRVRERLNLRDLRLGDLDGEPVDLVVADVSFISLTLLVDPLTAVLRPDGDLLVLVKPQFEVGREHLDRHGIVRDASRRAAAVEQVLATATELGWSVCRTAESRWPGAGGNLEHFVWCRRAPDGVPRQAQGTV